MSKNPTTKHKTRVETAPQAVEREDRVAKLMAMGKSAQEISAEIGIGLRATNQAMEHVKIRTEAEALIDPSTLSITAQDKLALATKQARQKLEVEIEQQLRDKMWRWLKNDLLPTYYENEKHYNTIIARRKGIMKRAEYRSILSCLHPDRVADEELKKRFEQAFNLFTKLEKLVLDETESPTTLSSLPKTVEELMKRRAEYEAQRAAERAKRSKHVNVVRR